MANVIECRGVYKNYLSGKMEVPVLRDVNFRMAEGEYTAVMGPSGSGKSTLMNIIGCLDVPTKGKVLIAGQDIAGLSDNEMSDLRLPLSYAHVPRKKRREMAIEALRKVGLEDRVNFMPSQLSGGQKQRVAIARAIVNNPKILLADEPTGALDSASGKQVMEIFRQLNREGVSILMITHDREIASHADRIVEIRDGVLREDRGTETFDAALREERSTETFDEALREDQSTENLEWVPDEEYNAAAHGAALSEEDIEDENCEDAGGGDAV